MNQTNWVDWKKQVKEQAHYKAILQGKKKSTNSSMFNTSLVIILSISPTLEISSFDLNTDRRAAERENFESWRLQKELEERETRHRQEQLRAEEEKREIQRMRREDLVHKAQPIKNFTQVHVLPSLRPLTEACSPNFSDRFQK